MSVVWMSVKLTLPKATAEKLRTICHRKGKTASDIIDGWISKANDDGVIGKQEQRMGDFAEHFLDALRKEQKQ